MIYQLMQKNRILATFKLEEEVKSLVVEKKYIRYLPLPLRKIAVFKDAYIVEESANTIRVNEEGCFLLEQWLDNREIPVNRDNRKKYLQSISSRKFMLDNYACSLVDCYWVRKNTESILWDEVKLYNLAKVESQLLVARSSSYSGTNATLGGQLEKYWYVSNDGKLHLCKKERNTNVLVIREVFATMVYERLNIIPYCTYSLVRNTHDEVIGCSCEAFTSENVELVTAYDLLEEVNCTQVDDVFEKLVTCAVDAGLNERTVREYLEVQTIVDFLITNRDRHQGNIGFLRDTETLELLGIAPVFDSGSSRHLEREHPETLEVTTVNGLYKTEMECLGCVKDFSRVDTNKLPKPEEYRQLLQLSTENSYRIDQLCSMYEQKVNWLREKQTTIQRRTSWLRAIPFL